MPASASNPVGHWEPQSVADLNDEILQALDSDWDDVFAFRPRKYLSNFDRFYLGRAVELLQQEFADSELIVLKDPRVSVLTGFWERALREAGYATHYIVMVRNPLEVAESLRSRDNFPREKSLLLWSSYMIAVERDTRSHARTFVSYNDLMRDWRGVRRRVEEQAGLPFPRDTAAAANEIEGFLDRRLRHYHVASEDLFSRTDVPEHAKILYKIFHEASQGADVESAALEPIRAELEKMDVLVGPLIADLRASTRQLSRELAELSDAHTNARERADSLEERLAAERALREAEAGKASQLSAEHETRLAELVERITVTVDERDRLAIEAEDKARAAAELVECLATAEAERIRLIEELEKRARDDAQLTERLTSLETLLTNKEAELAATQELLLRAKVEGAANEDKLAERFREITRLTERVEEKERQIELAKREAEAVRKSADAAAKLHEDRLAQRFGEIAKLTNLLKQHQERGEQADEQVSWLLTLYDRLGRNPRWWTLLPKSWARRRVHRRLRDAGLFDGDAYLRRYPDVAAANRDPLDHYLEHGYREGRLRKA
jgi:hypothetical protein